MNTDLPPGIPEICSEFIRPGDDTWRPTPHELRSHITEGLMPSFMTLATNGELTIVQCTHSGRVALIKSANILPKKRGEALKLNQPIAPLTARERTLNRIEQLKARLAELQKL
jgi:hypothetical protein